MDSYWDQLLRLTNLLNKSSLTNSLTSDKYFTLLTKYLSSIIKHLSGSKSRQPTLFYDKHSNTLILSGKYNCKFCPMTFKTPTGLTVHENVHTRRQVWLCQLCGKTYSSRASYIQHLQVSTLIKRCS